MVIFGLLLGGAGTARAQLSPGPLARAHAKLEGSSNCVQCHGLKKEPMSQRCLACHKEVAWLLDRDRGLHARERTGAKRECASCHPDHAGADFALIDWGGGGRERFDHKRTGWMLEGKHLRAKCEACHERELRRSPAAALSPRVNGAGWMALETDCASCHERDDVHRRTLGSTCERCHDADDWKRATRFDHARSTYPLTGKHADVACDKCHKAARFKLRPDSSGHVIGRFKPIPASECSDCHADPHKGRLSAKCGECHSTRGFSVIDKADFDHSLTRYALVGKHRAVQCESCHGVTLARRTPPFAKCGDCHAEAHYGRATLAGRPADCASCHRVEGFAPSTFTAPQHATTSFSLRGKHTIVSCAACHAASDSTVQATRKVMRRVQLRPSFAACSTCHADAHGGELVRSDSRRACSACHTDEGWTPSTFTRAQHAALALPLDGAHATTACRSCHPAERAKTAGRQGAPSPATTVSLRGAGSNCDACHVDPHAGRYAPGNPQASPEGCRACHDTRHFAPATLATRRHGSFGFALEGAHRALPCRDCHKEIGRMPARSTLRRVATTMPIAPLRFDRAPRTMCTACHADPHGGQFAGRRGGAACDACHDVARWSGASRLVHDRDASFPLAGAHQRVPCASCHMHVAQSGGGTRVQYRPLPSSCESCHKADVTRRAP
ncbi:MAG: hypothetical protein AABZ29_06880 [Gemmatimonadota bacterium]